MGWAGVKFGREQYDHGKRVEWNNLKDFRRAIIEYQRREGDSSETSVIALAISDHKGDDVHRQPEGPQLAKHLFAFQPPHITLL